MFTVFLSGMLHLAALQFAAAAGYSAKDDIVLTRLFGGIALGMAALGMLIAF